MRHTFLTVALSLALAIPAAAQQPLKITFDDGRVTVEATSVPVRTILTEWAKAGGTKVVGAERISGAPITVKLVNVTEAQALETILRSVAGYLAAPRNTLAGGPSMYDRILVMATTSAPAPAGAAAGRPAGNNPNAFAGTQRFVPPRQQPQRQEQPEQDEPDEPDENPPNPPVFTFPPPGQNNPPGAFVNGQAPPTEQGTAPTSPGFSSTPGVMINPSQPTFRPGTATPGMIVAPPPQTNVRPPGQ